MNYRSFPDDLRPSHAAGLLAHVGGSTVEIVLPLVLLFSTNPTVTLLAVIGMVVFHLFILSTFPLAVPLEWNVLFAFATVFLFWGHPAWEGYSVADISSPVLLVAIVARAAVLPGPRQPASRPGVVPAVDAPVRRQLGVGHVGVRARRRGQARQHRARRRQHRRPGRGHLPAAGRRDAADHADGLAVDAQPGSGAAVDDGQAPRRRHRHATRCARPSSAATRSSDSTSATATSTTSSSSRRSRSAATSSPASSSWPGSSRSRSTRTTRSTR